MEKFPVERKDLIKKLKEELGYDSYNAEEKAKRLEELIPEMIPLFMAWCKGDFVDYALGDVTIEYIMKKAYCNYLDAISWMSYFIKSPKAIEYFKNMNFERE